MAEVYAACPANAPEGSEACYAIKRLKQPWHDIPAARELFHREILAGRTISNPHVVAVLDGKVTQSQSYLVMPLLSGTSVRDQLASNRLPGLPLALWIARQTAQGLEAIDSAGWTHGDIQPDNIFLASDGHATLIDLGCCRSQAEFASVGERPVVGTPNYLAPEMFTSTGRTDIRSDIYSLGVMLYEILTGQLPYEGRNPAEVAELHRQGVPDQLRCLAPHLPKEVVLLVRSMLAKEPLRRPQTPRELVQRLVQLEIDSFAERIPA